MGLFTWLFGKGEPERVAVRELVWMNGANRARAVAKELGEHIASGRTALLLAHFPNSLAAIAPELLGANLPHEPIPDGLSPRETLKLAGGNPRVLFGLVRNLRLPELPADESEPQSPLPVLLAERHFLRRHDDRVTRFAEGLGSRAAVTIHVSLDDELLRLFAGEWVVGVLQRLGMKDGEAIESAMVTRRIRKSQDTLLQAVTEDVPADSPAEWLRANVRR